MRLRNALPALLVCLVLAPLTGCGGGDGTDTASPLPRVPAESRAPARGEGSQDPDDINGDGHRDLMVPISLSDDLLDVRIGVVFGSAQGLDPATRAVYGNSDLGVPQGPPSDDVSPESVLADTVVSADLDSDGFPEFVTTVWRYQKPSLIYVTWGGPGGPTADGEATRLQLPPGVDVGSWTMTRGDFDGDGHHDLAATADDAEARVEGGFVVLLYGPFTRAGEPARTDTGPRLPGGTLLADDIDPTGEPRATSLLLRHPDDGGQNGNTLFPARPGAGLSLDEGRGLREGNAAAFGDFDGDGLRDVAIADDGRRESEPEVATEPPHVDGSFTYYRGRGGYPVTLDLPEHDVGYVGTGGVLWAADPDGDGRDGILAPSDEGTTLVVGHAHTGVSRAGPWEAAIGERLLARPAGAADFDGDGRDELILASPSGGPAPTHWWITDGTTSRDNVSFATTTGFA
ncbi:hypothetical protein [Streptomyces sp. 6N223]|uniref:hypothetical protein n=1 Tax=Streptomyces sp. 6N223 TaxID=3457412 RepID=UPI003FD50A39